MGQGLRERERLREKKEKTEEMWMKMKKQRDSKVEGKIVRVGWSLENFELEK